MLLDSNIIIYAAQPEHSFLRTFIAENETWVSALSYVECLGYHLLKEPERQHLQEFFQAARLLPISQQVLDQTVALRQQQKRTLGDSIIAGTALVHELVLVTRNTEDFQWISQLQWVNPFDADTED